MHIRGLVGFVLLLHATPASAQSDFCGQLHDIVAEARTDFRSLRGARTESVASDTTTYDSTKLLPGADSCRVDVRKDISQAQYECTWRIASSTDLDRQYDAFVEAVPACFPDARLSADGERPSQFDGRLRPSIARYRLRSDLQIAIRKWSRATVSSGRTRITFELTRR